MKHTRIARTLMIAGAFGLAAGITQTASAATCSVDGATITDIDSVSVGAPLSASACDGAISGNLSFGELETELENGSLFSGDYAHLDWTFHGKIDDSGVQGGSVGADLDQTSGTWFADFSPDVTDTLALLLKGGSEGYSVFVWLPELLGAGGSRFDGTFDMSLAGLGDSDLSHIGVAGVLTGTTVIPIPATLPLFLTGLLGFGFLARRRRQMMAEA